MSSIGQPDPKIMEIGKTYSTEKYPLDNHRQLVALRRMNNYCAARPQHTDYQIDEVAQPVSTDGCVPTVLTTASITRTKPLTRTRHLNSWMTFPWPGTSR